MGMVVTNRPATPLPTIVAHRLGRRQRVSSDGSGSGHGGVCPPIRLARYRRAPLLGQGVSNHAQRKAPGLPFPDLSEASLLGLVWDNCRRIVSKIEPPDDGLDPFAVGPAWSADHVESWPGLEDR